jgi:integrase
MTTGSVSAQTRKSTEHEGASPETKSPAVFDRTAGREPASDGQKTSRNPHRDSTMILVAYRHGLRVGELTDLRWEDVHLDRAEIYV